MGPSGKANVVEATLMVTGNIMGSGIFLVPVTLAAFGSLSASSWLFSLLGVSCLALVYARLSALDDPSSSSSFALSFGPLLSCLVTVSYLASVVCGNVAGAVVGVSNVSFFLSLSPLLLSLFTLLAIWSVTLLNLFGPRVVLRIQGVCTVLTCLPVFCVALGGWFFFDSALFLRQWNVSGASDWIAMQRCLNIQLWAFTGLETAAAVSAVVRDPRRLVPVATCGGVLIAAVGYTLSCSVLMGLFPVHELAAMDAPFVSAMRLIFGSPRVASAVALCALIGCFGSLAGWMLVAGQTAAAAARDGLFPAVFGVLDAGGVNRRGLILLSIAMSLIVCSLPLRECLGFRLVALLTVAQWARILLAWCRPFRLS